jgi:hypothetical protein
VAEINRVGFWTGGWAVKDDGSLEETDLLLIGLIYHSTLWRNIIEALLPFPMTWLSSCPTP